MSTISTEELPEFEIQHSPAKRSIDTISNLEEGEEEIRSPKKKKSEEEDSTISPIVEERPESVDTVLSPNTIQALETIEMLIDRGWSRKLIECRRMKKVVPSFGESEDDLFTYIRDSVELEHILQRITYHRREEGKLKRRFQNLAMVYSDGMFDELNKKHNVSDLIE